VRISAHFVFVCFVCILCTVLYVLPFVIVNDGDDDDIFFAVRCRYEILTRRRRSTCHTRRHHSRHVTLQLSIISVQFQTRKLFPLFRFTVVQSRSSLRWPRLRYLALRENYCRPRGHRWSACFRALSAGRTLRPQAD